MAEQKKPKALHETVLSAFLHLWIQRLLQRGGNHYKLLSGGNAQLAVDVLVVIFEGILLDVQLRHDLFRGFSFQIGMIDDALRRRQRGALRGEMGALFLEGSGSRLFRIGRGGGCIGGRRSGRLCGQFIRGIRRSWLIGSFFAVLKQQAEKQQEYLADDIRNGQQLEIDADQLLYEPHADIDENSRAHEDGVNGGIHIFMYAGVEDHCGGGHEIGQQIEQVQTVQRAVFLFKHCRSVDKGERNVLVVNVQNARTGGNQENDRADADQRARQIFAVFQSAGIQDDHQHGQRQEHGAQIGQPVRPQRGFQRL